MFSKIIRTGLAIGVTLIAVATAQAADLRAPYKSPVYSAPSYANWSGFYVGLNAGYGFGTSKWDFPAVSTSPKGVLAGLTLGYNFQTGLWLWGVEGDLDYSGMKGSIDCGGGATCETKLSWLATARARLGYTGWTNWLPYITAGAAFGDVKATNSLTGSADKMRVGWVAGLGLEYALWTNWSVKGEYLYADLGSFDCGAACGAATDNVTFKSSIIRLGVNYRF